MITAAAVAPVAGSEGKRPALCIFSKHLAQFQNEQLARKAKEIGFDGVDLTVRPKGHVEPERAAGDLPRIVEILREAGLSVPMITTDLTSPAHPTARPILSTAAKLKIPFYKLGYWYYRERDPETVLAEVKPALDGLVAIARQYGIVTGFHNHSDLYVGSAVWDIRELIRDLDPKWVGCYFDPGHATIEGGLGGWQESLRLVMPRLKMVALKDFYWEKGDGRWRPRWCPMGEGMVNWPKVFAAFASARFDGPLSLHVEYEAKDELAAMARDVEFIRKQMQQAWG